MTKKNRCVRKIAFFLYEKLLQDRLVSQLKKWKVITRKEGIKLPSFGEQNYVSEYHIKVYGVMIKRSMKNNAWWNDQVKEAVN